MKTWNEEDPYGILFHIAVCPEEPCGIDFFKKSSENRDPKKSKKPKYLFLENVDRLLSSPATQRGRDFAVMLSCLHEQGYAVEWKIINAADYSMPQRRRRVYIVGYHKSTPLYKKMKSLKPEDFKYINCTKVMEFCNKVNKSKKSK